jgi:hypothetical protein
LGETVNSNTSVDRVQVERWDGKIAMLLPILRKETRNHNEELKTLEWRREENTEREERGEERRRIEKEKRGEKERERREKERKRRRREGERRAESGGEEEREAYVTQ